MAEDRRKSNPENPGLKVVPKRRTSDKRADNSQPISSKGGERGAKAPEKNAVAIVGENGEAVLLPLNPANNMARSIIALAAGGAICYFGKPVLVSMVCALLLGFLIDPVVRLLQRLRLPRAIAAFLVLLALTAGVW